MDMFYCIIEKIFCIADIFFSLRESSNNPLLVSKSPNSFNISSPISIAFMSLHTFEFCCYQGITEVRGILVKMRLTFKNDLVETFITLLD